MSNQDKFKGEEHFYGKIRPESFWKRHSWKIIVGGLLMLLIVVASVAFSLGTKLTQSSLSNKNTPGATAVPPTQIPSTPTPAPDTPTVGDTATVGATPTAPVTQGLPCVVNLNTWTGGSPDWVVHNGILYNDGSNGSNNGPTIIAPCQPGNPNYAVEAKIQVTSPSGGCFGLAFRGSSAQNGWQGYKADVCGLNTAYISAYGDDNALTQAPFTPGSTVHTYRIVVKDTTLQFFIDDNLVDTTTDNRLLTTETGQGVGLYSQNVQLAVTSFQVTAAS